jgi:hypothetical protein
VVFKLSFNLATYFSIFSSAYCNVVCRLYCKTLKRQYTQSFPVAKWLSFTTFFIWNFLKTLLVSPDFRFCYDTGARDTVWEIIVVVELFKFTETSDWIHLHLLKTSRKAPFHCHFRHWYTVIKWINFNIKCECLCE